MFAALRWPRGASIRCATNAQGQAQVDAQLAEVHAPRKPGPPVAQSAQ